MSSNEVLVDPDYTGGAAVGARCSEPATAAASDSALGDEVPCAANRSTAKCNGRHRRAIAVARSGQHGFQPGFAEQRERRFVAAERLILVTRQRAAKLQLNRHGGQGLVGESNASCCNRDSRGKKWTRRQP